MKYNIKDADGNITNTITADADFVEANFENYELWTDPNPAPAEPTAEEAGRTWRDIELMHTDWIVPLLDHPQREAYITYRESLRQWPSTESFPETKPEL